MEKSKLNNLAEQIVLLRKKINAKWTLIDHYKKYGTIADKKIPILARNVSDLSLGQIITACFTLPPYLSKAKAKYEKMPEGPEKIKLGIDIKIKETELQNIKALRE